MQAFKIIHSVLITWNITFGISQNSCVSPLIKEQVAKQFMGYHSHSYFARISTVEEKPIYNLFWFLCIKADVFFVMRIHLWITGIVKCRGIVWYYFCSDMNKPLLTPDKEARKLKVLIPPKSKFVTIWVLLRLLKGLWMKDYV